MRPHYPNWGDHPLAVVIVVLAALVTIAGSVFSSGSWLRRVIEAERAADTPAGVLDPTQPTAVPENPATSTEPNSPSAPPTQGVSNTNNRNDIKFECDRSSIISGKWYLDCHIKNNSENIIWWRDTFQLDGSELGWSCLEKTLEATCSASTIYGKK